MLECKVAGWEVVAAVDERGTTLKRAGGKKGLCGGSIVRIRVILPWPCSGLALALLRPCPGLALAWLWPGYGSTKEKGPKHLNPNFEKARINGRWQMKCRSNLSLALLWGTERNMDMT